MDPLLPVCQPYHTTAVETDLTAQVSALKVQDPPEAPLDGTPLLRYMLSRGDMSQVLKDASSGSPKDIRHLHRYIITSTDKDEMERLFCQFQEKATTEAQEAMWRCFFHGEGFNILLAILESQGAKIEYLSFCHDRLREPGKMRVAAQIGAVIERCPNLMRLVIKGPSLNDEDQELFKIILTASKLRDLDLGGIQNINFSSLESLNKLEELRSLVLSIEGSSGSLGVLSQLSRLEVLCVRGHLAKEFELVGLEKMQNLRVVEFTGFWLEPATINAFKSLPYLRALRVALRDPYELQEVCKLVQLERLSLECSYMFSDHLLKLTELKELTLYLPYADHVTCGDVTALIDGLPNLTSFWANSIKSPHEKSDLDSLATAIGNKTNLNSLSLECEFALPLKLVQALLSHQALKHLYLKARSMPRIDYELLCQKSPLKTLGICLENANPFVVAGASSLNSLEHLELSFPLENHTLEPLRKTNLVTFVHNTAMFDTLYDKAHSSLSKEGLQTLASIPTLRHCKIYGSTELTFKEALEVLEESRQLRSLHAPGLETPGLESQKTERPDLLRHMQSIGMSYNLQDFWEQVGCDLLTNPDTLNYRRLAPPPFNLGSAVGNGQ